MPAVQTAAVIRVVDLSADCAPAQCGALRIIDGKAEACRIDAMRRAGQDS